MGVDGFLIWRAVKGYLLPRSRRLLVGAATLYRQPLFWLSALLLSLAILAQIQDPPFRQSIRNLSFDHFQRWQPRSNPSHLPLRVVAIDEASLVQVGQWPWPRFLLAEVLDRLFELGAAVVVFNVVFSEVDRTSPSWLLDLWPEYPGLEEMLSGMPDHDTLLARAIARGVTVTGFSLDPVGDGPPRPGPRWYLCNRMVRPAGFCPPIGARWPG